MQHKLCEWHERIMHLFPIAKSAGAVEYTDCFSVRPLNKCPDMALNNLMVMLELWGMQSTPSLSSLPGPLWPGMVALDRVLSMG